MCTCATALGLLIVSLCPYAIKDMNLYIRGARNYFFLELLFWYFWRVSDRGHLSNRTTRKNWKHPNPKVHKQSSREKFYCIHHLICDIFHSTQPSQYQITRLEWKGHFASSSAHCILLTIKQTGRLSSLYSKQTAKVAYVANRLYEIHSGDPC